MKKTLYLRWLKAIDILPEPMRTVYMTALLMADFKEKWSSGS